MVYKNSFRISALALGLVAGTAQAHEIPTPTSGDPYFAAEPAILWVNDIGTANNGVINNNNILAYHFDVTTAGSLDVYTDDHDLAASSSSLFIYKLDQDGHDWTLTNFNYEGAGPSSGPTNPNNIFGIHRTGYINEFTTGKSDAGVRSNFDLGSYVAFVVGSQGRVPGHSPFDAVQEPTGAKLSTGFSWHWLNDDTSEVYTNRDGLVDLTIKASPLSSAIAGPAVEPVPVPGAVWLMGTVLAGFGAFGRKKSTEA